MVANTAPIFTLRPDMSTDNGTTMPQPITAAAGDYTGISANYRLSHTASADGSYVRSIIAKASGTNAVAVARVFINNGLTPGTAANNGFFAEIGLPATTASTTTATVEIEFPLEVGMKGATRLYIGLGAAVVAGWTFTVVSGQYV